MSDQPAGQPPEPRLYKLKRRYNDWGKDPALTDTRPGQYTRTERLPTEDAWSNRAVNPISESVGRIQSMKSGYLAERDRIRRQRVPDVPRGHVPFVPTYEEVDLADHYRATAQPSQAPVASTSSAVPESMLGLQARSVTPSFAAVQSAEATPRYDSPDPIRELDSQPRTSNATPSLTQTPTFLRDLLNPVPDSPPEAPPSFGLDSLGHVRQRPQVPHLNRRRPEPLFEDDDYGEANVSRKGMYGAFGVDPNNPVTTESPAVRETSNTGRVQEPVHSRVASPSTSMMVDSSGDPASNCEDDSVRTLDADPPAQTVKNNKGKGRAHPVLPPNTLLGSLAEEKPKNTKKSEKSEKKSGRRRNKNNGPDPDASQSTQAKRHLAPPLTPVENPDAPRQSGSGSASHASHAPLPSSPRIASSRPTATPQRSAQAPSPSVPVGGPVATSEGPARGNAFARMFGAGQSSSSSERVWNADRTSTDAPPHQRGSAAPHVEGPDSIPPAGSATPAGAASGAAPNATSNISGPSTQSPHASTSSAAHGSPFSGPEGYQQTGVFTSLPAGYQSAILEIQAQNNDYLFNQFDARQLVRDERLKNEMMLMLTQFFNARGGGSGPGQAAAQPEAATFVRKRGKGTEGKKIGDVEQAIRAHPQYRAFLAAVRSHWKFLLDVNKSKEIAPELPTCAPLTVQEVDDFMKHKAHRVMVTTREGFRYDFFLPRAHPYCLHVFDFFVRDFLVRLDSKEWFPTKSPLADMFLQEDVIRAAIYNHVKGLKTAYNRRHVLGESEEMEMERAQGRARAQRKYSTFGSRFGAIAAFAPHAIPVLSTARQRAVSSDESDREGRGDMDANGNPLDCTYTIDPVWHSEAFRIWLHSWDGLATRLRERKVGMRAIPGTNPHTRIYTRKVNEKSIAPPGLPRNAYDRAWYKSLSPFEKKELKRGPKFDFKPIEVSEEALKRYHRRGAYQPPAAAKKDRPSVEKSGTDGDKEEDAEEVDSDWVKQEMGEGDDSDDSDSDEELVDGRGLGTGYWSDEDSDEDEAPSD